MNPDIKRAWVEALRSGEYEQCYDALSDGKGFCCLGVLCELAVKQGVIRHPTYNGEHGVKYGGSQSTIPASVAGWAEMGIYQQLIHKDQNFRISLLNDGLKLSFSEISDLIESQL